MHIYQHQHTINDGTVTLSRTDFSADDVSIFCNQGASLMVKYVPRANQDFFSQLFFLSEVNPDCDIPVFIAFDHSLLFHGISMHLNAGCPWLPAYLSSNDAYTVLH